MGLSFFGVIFGAVSRGARSPRTVDGQEEAVRIRAEHYGARTTDSHTPVARRRDGLAKDAIPPDGPGLREVAYGSQKLVVENTCFYAGNRARIDDERDVKRGLCKYPGSWRDYLEKLGVVGRDTAKHPWGE